MPNIETSSELADHLADLLGIYGDIRCETWRDYPPDFIGPIPAEKEQFRVGDGLNYNSDHIDDCNCRVFWVLDMASRMRKAVVNEFSMDLFNRTITTGTITGRLASTEPNLQNVPSNTPLGEEVRKQALKNRPNKAFEADYAYYERKEVKRSGFYGMPWLIKTFKEEK